MKKHFVVAFVGALMMVVACATSTTGPPSACCRVCQTGKACGNSCIARDKTCHKGVGCACNGSTADSGPCPSPILMELTPPPDGITAPRWHWAFPNHLREETSNEGRLA